MRATTAALTLLLATSVSADEALPLSATSSDSSPSPDDKDCAKRFKDEFKKNALRGNRPSYLVYTHDPMTSEGLWQYFLSLQYSFRPWGWWGDIVHEDSIQFDGLYDFYLGTRESSPVIPRQQNPGFGLSWYPDRWASSGTSGKACLPDKLTFGYYHESNGQRIETLTQYNSTKNADDYVSQGWDYVYVSASKQFLFCKRDLMFSVYPAVRLFTGYEGGFTSPSEERDFRRPANDQPHIDQYDGLRFIAQLDGLVPKNCINLNYWGVSGELRTGYGHGAFASNWSYRLTGTVKIARIPLHVFWFSGYGPYIAYFDRHHSQFGGFLRLW